LHKNEYEGAHNPSNAGMAAAQRCCVSSERRASPQQEPEPPAWPAAGRAGSQAMAPEMKGLQLFLLALMRGTWVLSWPEGSSASLLQFCHLAI